MTISVAKTKTIITYSRYPVRCEIESVGRSIKQVMNFKYLGAEIPNLCNSAPELNYQISRAAIASDCLRDAVCNNK